MFKFAIATAIALTTVNAALAAEPFKTDPRIAQLCGEDHQNEIVEPGDGALGTDGYTISSLDVSLDPRDARIIPARVITPYLCTETNDDQSVKYLFVPSAEWGDNFEAP